MCLRLCIRLLVYHDQSTEGLGSRAWMGKWGEGATRIRFSKEAFCRGREKFYIEYKG